MQRKSSTANNLPQQSDFRLYLQSELARRCSQNPKYSLRAFAKFLNVTPAFLSHLLRGRRSVTVKSVDRFGKRLGLDPRQVEQFRTYHQKSKFVTDPLSKDEVKTVLKMRQLSLDQFQMISDWYHYAILELLSVDQFKPDQKWMARVLGISVSEVNSAVERLMRLGFITMDTKGIWKNASGNNTTIGNDFTASAFRNLQKGILDGALTALENLPVEDRDQSSLTFSMDTQLLPEVKSCIKEFRRKILRFQERSQRKNQVYQLSISFYPILKNLKKGDLS